MSFKGIPPFKPSSFGRNKNKRHSCFRYLKIILLNLYRLLAILNAIYTTISGLIFFVQAYAEVSTFLDATAMTANIGFLNLSIMKYIVIMKKSVKIKKILDFSAKKYFNNNEENQSKYKLHKHLGLAVKLQKLQLLTAGTTEWLFNLLPLIQVISNYFNGLSFSPLLPYGLWYPFEINSIGLYAIIYVLQSHVSLVTTHALIAMDCVTIGILSLCFMHFDYIANGIKALQLSGNDHKAAEKELRSLLIYHQEMLSLSKDVNDMFSMTILCNFLASAFILCFVGFQTTVYVDFTELFLYLLFLGYELIQLWTVCYVGERLIQSSTKIAMAAYNQEWYEMDAKNRKTMLLILTRAQTPALINAKGFAIVNLESFTKVCKIAYKFFALLRTIYAN